MLQLHVALMHSPANEVWRRLVLHPRFTLEQLHVALQAAFGWRNSRLHMFVNKARQRFSIPRMLDGECEDERKVFLPEAFPQTGSAMLYLYDFGDGWQVQIRSEGMVNPETIEYPLDAFIQAGRGIFSGKPRAAMCIGATGAAPPEDCGGIPGYEAVLAATRTAPEKRTRSQRSLAEWVADGDRFWHPDHLDLSLLCEHLARMRVKKANQVKPESPGDGPRPEI